MKTFLPSCLAVSLLFAAGSLRAETTYTYTRLHAFAGTDGAGPEATLIQGTDGNFYGTTSGNTFAPKTAASAIDNGTIFKITPAGTLTTLHVFAGVDGTNPAAPLVQMPDGFLYGTTTGGYNSEGEFTTNGVTIFKIATNGTGFTKLVQGAPKVGLTNAYLTKGKDGNLYGVNRQGGAISDGSIFRLTTAGVVTTLYSFKDGSDGAFPQGPLIQAADGDFYGCCEGGGGTSSTGNGTIFKITPAGVYTQIHALAAGGAQGAGPQGIVQAGDGNLYGACQQGGDVDIPNGSFFRVTTAGVFTKLLNFDEGNLPVDPVSGPIVGPDGALYGTGKEGGSTGEGYGGVYRITTAGVYSSIAGFGGPAAAYPFGGLVLGRDGSFYGTTAGKLAETDPTTGGDKYGTVFKLTPSAAGTPTPPPTTPTPTPAGGLPTVTVVATVPVTQVGGAMPGAFTFSISAEPTVKTTVFYTLKGDAINGTDYAFLSGKVKFKPGKPITRTVQVVPMGDLEGASQKKVKLTVTPDDAVFFDATPGAAKVKILAP